MVVLLVVAGYLFSRGVEQRLDLMRRFEAPSFRHPLGTDHFGRDVLRLAVSGLFRSVPLASATVAIGVLLGGILALSGSVNRVAHTTLSSFADTMLALPTLAIALVVAAAISPGPLALLIALGIGGWTPYFRLISAHTLAAEPNLWIEAAVASGASRARIVFRHILPNVAAPAIALAASRFGHAVVAVSSLSFLGVGPQPPSSEWGATLAQAQPYIDRAPWAAVGPAAAIFLATSCALAIGRRLTERLSL